MTGEELQKLNSVLMLERLRDLIRSFLDRGELKTYEFSELVTIRDEINNMLRMYGDVLNSGSSPSYNTLKGIVYFINDELNERNKAIISRIDINKINSDINEAFDKFCLKRKENSYDNNTI